MSVCPCISEISSFYKSVVPGVKFDAIAKLNGSNDVQHTCIALWFWKTLPRDITACQTAKAFRQTALRDKPYQERLRILDLPTLKFRRLRGDMIETYKVVSGTYDTSFSTEIPIISEYATWGNSLKIANHRCHYNLRRYSFSTRITNVWNSLPFSVITAPSVNHLKIDWIITGHHKNLDMIGKQNYQELGVEAELNFEFFEFYHYIFQTTIWAHKHFTYAHNICYVMLVPKCTAPGLY